MNIEVMAWTSLVAGLATFVAVKKFSWLPMSVRLMIWFLGISLMGFAMVYLVAAYDPDMTKPAITIAAWIMLASRIAVPILVIYAVIKFGSKGVGALAVSSLLTTACSTRSEVYPKLDILLMGVLFATGVWLLGEHLSMMFGRGTDETISNHIVR